MSTVHKEKLKTKTNKNSRTEVNNRDRINKI